MKIAICEDEKVYMDIVKKMTREFFLKKEIDVSFDMYTDGRIFIERMNTESNYEKTSYDLILMDIQMKHSDGMEIAAKLREKDKETPIIFVTGLEDRAVEGFRVDALDYVVKQKIDTELYAALERFYKKVRQESLMLTLRDGEEAILKIKDIIAVESDSRGSKVKTAKACYEISAPLGVMMDKLPEDEYTECHKGVYVRICEIERIGKDIVFMSDGSELPVSRRKRGDVMNAVISIIHKEV